MIVRSLKWMFLAAGITLASGNAMAQPQTKDSDEANCAARFSEILARMEKQFVGKRDFPCALTAVAPLNRPRICNDIRLYYAAEVLEKLNGSRSPMSAASSRFGNSVSTWRSQVSGSTPQARQVSIKL